MLKILWLCFFLDTVCDIGLMVHATWRLVSSYIGGRRQHTNCCYIIVKIRCSLVVGSGRNVDTKICNWCVKQVRRLWLVDDEQVGVAVMKTCLRCPSCSTVRCCCCRITIVVLVMSLSVSSTSSLHQSRAEYDWLVNRLDRLADQGDPILDS